MLKNDTKIKWDYESK
jgi:hypothetical protein